MHIWSPCDIQVSISVFPDKSGPVHRPRGTERMVDLGGKSESRISIWRIRYSYSRCLLLLRYYVKVIVNLRVQFFVEMTFKSIE